MKKFLLTLIVTMLTCIGAWAGDGVVTLTPTPSGTIEMNLTDDKDGKMFTLASPFVNSAPHNVIPTVVYAEDGESATDILSCAWDANNKLLTIKPIAVTSGPVAIMIKVVGPGWSPETTGTDLSESFQVSINNEQKIPATLSVPSLRVGDVGKNASVTVTGGLEYSVEYSVIAGDEYLEVVPTTGALTPKAQGTATIQAVVTPQGSAASTYVAKTLTADVTVEKAIEGTINTTFDNLTLNLGQFYEIASPSATWDPELTPVGGSTSYYTSWEITDPTGCINGVYDKNSNKIQLIPINPSDDPVTLTVRAKYIQQNWVNSAVESEDVMAVSPATTFNVTIVTPTCDFKLTPIGDVALDLVDDYSAGFTKTASATWSNTDADMYFEVTCDNEAAVGASNNNGTITIKPKALTATPATVTVSAIWKKVVNGQEIKLTESKSFQVTVSDKTLASSLSLGEPSATAFPQGANVTVPVTYEPGTAVLATTVSPADAGVTAEISGNVLTITAAENATVGNYTVTVSPKSGSVDENGDEIQPQSVTVTVEDKTLVKSIYPLSDMEIQKGKTTNVPVFYAPYTAVFQDPSSDNTNVTVSYAQENGNPNYNVLVIDATGANVGEVANITITPKDGSTAPAQTFKVTVTKPEIPVTNEMSQLQMQVGNFVPYTPAADGDYDVTYTAVGTNKNGQPIVTVTDDQIIANHIGVATITYTVTPTGSTASEYKPYSFNVNVIVKPAKPNFTFSVSPTEFESNKEIAQEGEISFSLSGGSYPMVTPSFTIEGGTSHVSIDGTVLKIAEQAPAQQFVVKVSFDPNDEDYEPLSGSVRILVSDPTAKVTVSVDADGVYTVHVPSPGAFGGIADEPTTVEYLTGTDLAGLKNATKVKVTGLLANSDVRELVNLIGGTLITGSNKNTSVCTSLDMGEAKMTEQILPGDNVPSKDNQAGGAVCSFVEPDNGKYMGSVTELVLPQPAVGVTGGTILPANFNTFFGDKYTNSINALESLTIPEGWTEIADYFGKYNGDGSTTFVKLTTLKLANSIEKIGAFAFSDFNVQVLDMPYNIKRINKGAFAPSPNLQDVYFFGPAPEFVHTNAFAGDTQYCNNTVDDNGLKNKLDPTITRFEYYVGSKEKRVLACLLHYPKEYKEDYIDMTRVYDVIPADMPYSKGFNIFTPDGWTTDFMNAIKAALAARYPEQRKNLSHDDADPNIYIGSVLDYGVKDAFYGYSMIWPSQSQMTTGFGIAQAGYRWNGTPLSPINQYDPTSSYYIDGSIDKRGLYQFIVSMSNSDMDFKFKQDQWYTISLAFDMTADQVKEVFGANTQVCRFSSVTREINGDDDKTLVLEFRKSTMGDRTGALDGTSYVADGMEPAGEYTGIRHHYPYMIKPSGTVNNKYIYQEDGVWHFDGDGFQRITGTLQPEKITAGGIEYVFAPIMTEVSLKKNSYILVERKDKAVKADGNYVHEYVFYKGVKKYDVYVDGGKANQNTSYVQLSPEDGAQEFEDFFKDATPISFGTANQAPINASIFGDDEETNAIEKVVIVCGTDKVADNKVYTINGQLVNSSVLAPGLYIKNGKKFIVK